MSALYRPEQIVEQNKILSIRQPYLGLTHDRSALNRADRTTSALHRADVASVRRFVVLPWGARRSKEHNNCLVQLARSPTVPRQKAARRNTRIHEAQ